MAILKKKRIRGEKINDKPAYCLSLSECAEWSIATAGIFERSKSWVKTSLTYPYT